MAQKMADLPTLEEYEHAELLAERDAARAQILELHEKVAFLESREVCAAAHDNIDECGYCQRDRADTQLARALEAMRTARDELDQCSSLTTNHTTIPHICNAIDAIDAHLDRIGKQP